MIHTPSPNFEARKPGFEIPTILVIHYTDCKTPQEALDILCDPLSQASAHYLIEENGTCHQLVEESMRAWHAGTSYWRGCTDVNSASIGIELANPGHRYGLAPFPLPQKAALLSLARELLDRYTIPPMNIVAHSDIAPLRKKDPGELFDWQYLAAHGVGAYPKPPLPPLQHTTAGEVVALLARIGYNPLDLEAAPERVIEAFCRRYLPLHFMRPLALEEIGSMAQAVLKLYGEV